MRNLKNWVACLLGATCTLNLSAQQENSYIHEQSDGYEWPTDKEVLAKLDKWQDQKFGVLFHWGLYSQAGKVESWSICSEDWITRDMDSYVDYKKWYWGLMDSFNPTDFNPEQWADVMQDAGMKYMLFTTKHHDGFCMFDSKYSDFSIAKGPFAADPRKDVARHVFDAFRKKGFMMGCYFSKPDWHYEYYWSPYYATPNRSINYKKERHPDWWKNYQQFTYNQMNELMTNYGSFDILWLDGGWETGDDVGLNELLAKVRTSTQPGLISVDRTIRGKNENYQTPERSIPAKQMNHPWESCITLSDNWGWVPGSVFKSANRVVSILTEITAKGGCLVLGVGPTPQGVIEPEVAERLHEIGEWLRGNGKAIYNTRTTPDYNDGNVWFTADKDGETIYAVYVLNDGDTLPRSVEWRGNVPIGKMTMLKGNKRVKYVCKDGKVTVTLPEGLKNEPVAFCFKLRK
ncbi:alpha-L-fucosidase [Bacteroides helcogenes]|uniref:alpha-L-fucosidase n=1 Tax=Bacteroides helcogenes (strain ATCC 35417 / DSM 20613 / JCM 6297 / CCUG 15421 / P 36-108) TaxID=693979 RepID=E6SVM1_BACT6|nr:alpha-L-fucosidase [Bacteroides helcogenes]ADV43482.1 glycoside hydrolase family 29 (alpha-L-fucosidase) [Bacteroides helcogenes P 36-108]MDY5239207.1 alpha-L-fucosidase [Bacteroides helcogenes]